MARRAALWLALLVDRAGVAVASACDHFPDGTCQNETATPEEAVLLQHQTPKALEVAASAAEAAAANACKGKKEKVTVKLDGKILDHTVANFFPVDVGQGGKLQIAVCNSWNIDTDGDITTPPVMPDALVGAVGAKAEVDIVVSNSGNVDIGGKLALGVPVDSKDIQDETEKAKQQTDMKLDDLRNGCKDDSNLLQRGLSAAGANATARETAGRREKRAGHSRANGTRARGSEERAGGREMSVLKSGYTVAMLPKMVTGKVDSDALIKITVTKSANVNLKKESSSVQISGATLMNELVSPLTEDLVQATIKIDIMSSANVNAASKGGGSLLMVGPACLTAAQVLAGDMSGTDVVVNFKDSASVTVDTVTMDRRQPDWFDRPRLTEPVISSPQTVTGDIAAMEVSISMLRVAKVRGTKWVHFGDNAPLLDSAVDLVATVTNSKHQVVLSDVGNVELEGVPDGLIQVFDLVHAVRQMKGSSELSLKVGNVANLRAPKHVGSWLSNTLTFTQDNLEDSKVHVEIRDSFILKVDELLLDTPILFKVSKVAGLPPDSLKRSQMVVKVANSFNLYGSVLWIINYFIADVVDLESPPLDHSTMSISLTGSFNMKGGAGSIVCVEDFVLPSILKAWRSSEPTEDSKYDFVLKNVAQVQTSHFKMYGDNTLLGSVASFDGIVGTDVTASVQQTANIKAEKVEMNNGGSNKAHLMYYVFAVHSVDASSTVKLKLSGVAKVSASDLSVSGTDLLSEVCYLTAPVSGSVSIDITDAANVGAKTALFTDNSFLFWDAASTAAGGETYPTVQVSMVSVADLSVRKSATLAQQSFLMGLRDTTFGKLSLMHTAMATGKVNFEKTNSPSTSSRPCQEQDLDTRADSFINTCVPKAAPAPPAP